MKRSLLGVYVRIYMSALCTTQKHVITTNSKWETKTKLWATESCFDCGPLCCRCFSLVLAGRLLECLSTFLFPHQKKKKKKKRTESWLFFFFPAAEKHDEECWGEISQAQYVHEYDPVNQADFLTWDVFVFSFYFCFCFWRNYMGNYYPPLRDS